MPAKERKPKRWEEYKKQWEIPEARTDEPVGLYPRQSTEKQKKNNRQSFEKQTIDAVEDLVKRGWSRDIIKIYDQDIGTSAAKPLEKREAISEMVADIRERRIRSVRAAEVDRLFRDEDRIDSNWFIKICKDADCLVITDRMIYDLNNPRHRKWFREEVDRSWEFYESQILIRAHELQDRARSKGLYTGGPVNVGFIVDKTRGSKTFMKYIPYPYMGDKLLEIFQDLYDSGASIGFILRELDTLPYVFPAEEQWVREQGLFSTNLEPVPGTKKDATGEPTPIGYKLSEQGLKKMIRNRVYVGDWPYDGGWIEGNHEGIIPRDLFDALNEMLDERESLASPRNHYTHSPSVVHDVLEAGPEGTKYMYITVQHDTQSYRVLEKRGAKCVIRASFKMEDIEREFVQKFREKLANRKEFENYERHLKEEHGKIDERRKTLLDLRNLLSSQIDGLFLSLESTELKPHERDEIIKERRRKIERRDAIQREINIKQPLAQYHKLKDLIERMGKYWNRYPLDERQGLVKMLVKQVYLEPLSCHFIKMTIQWKWFPEDIGIIWRSQPASIHWTPEEDDVLNQMYPIETSENILNALPRRTWDACVARAATPTLGLKRQVAWDVKNRQLSQEDVHVIEQYQISAENMQPRDVLCVTWRMPFL